jgi:hypothetical protein
LKTIITILLFALCISLRASIIDLSGAWALKLDPQDQGISERWWEKRFDDKIVLPSTLAQAKKGEPLQMDPALPSSTPEKLNLDKGIMFGRSTNYAAENTALLHLYARYSYVGPAWYRRRVEIPSDWRDKDVELELERVIWKTETWINGHYFGPQNSLVTPHRFEISQALRAGENEIVIRVDNRRQSAIGNPHAYTDETQTIWNGIIGKIELAARDKVRIDDLQLRPNLASNGVNVTFTAHNGTGAPMNVPIFFQAAPENFHGEKIPAWQTVISVSQGDHEQKNFYQMTGGYERWSEFNPRLYRMTASLGDGSEKTSSVFGMREFKAEGRHFAINGQPVFLRGTVESCVFPKTGFPDMTKKTWEKMFSTAKACGLNHFRFHTWCPPEAAFDAADRYGFYLQVELPDWSFHIGQNSAVTDFFREEGERMIREYGNHPSWVMFTMGNELKGDYAVLDNLETHFRALDPQLLYSSTTYPSAHGKKPDAPDDYYISLQTTNGRVRGQFILNDTAPNTLANYSSASAAVSIPLISHEVGQYCVYPNVAELPKYNDVLRPVALEAIGDDLKNKGRLNEVADYVRDSGKLAVLLYKEEIERALRTTNQAGFQLLAMNDFPGQGTSTVGPFDAFWDQKGFVKPSDFRKFCGPVVPLALMSKRTFENDEPFDADVELANFGASPLTNSTIIWKLQADKKPVGKGQFTLEKISLGTDNIVGRIHQSLMAITRPSKLKLSIEIPGTTIANDWEIWVYPKAEKIPNADNVAIFRSFDPACRKALLDGKRVLLLPTESEIKSPLAAQFTAVFWNPVMFPNQSGSMGAMIDTRGKLLADFPTDSWSNWQWWELFHQSFAVDLGALKKMPEAPVRFIDKFNRNALPAAVFEAQVGPGRLVVCTLDISTDPTHRVAARQLRRSILEYMSGGQFHPVRSLEIPDLNTLFRPE